jgi:hypothetical protein
MGLTILKRKRRVQMQLNNKKGDIPKYIAFFIEFLPYKAR